METDTDTTPRPDTEKLAGPYPPAFAGHDQMDWPTLDLVWRAQGWGHDVVANRTTVARFISSIDALLSHIATLEETIAGEPGRVAPAVEALDRIAAFKPSPATGDWADRVDGQGYNRAGKYASDIARIALAAIRNEGSGV